MTEPSGKKQGSLSRLARNTIWSWSVAASVVWQRPISIASKPAPSARILILDNHDDFGGHAKRNEFHLAGRMLLTNGGTVSIESPFPYSREARGLLAELGIDPPALQKKYADDHASGGLGFGYSSTRKLLEASDWSRTRPGVAGRARQANGRTFSRGRRCRRRLKQDIIRIQEAKVDYMEGVSQEQKKARLSKMSYKDFLLNVVKAHADVIPFYQSRTHGLYGIGIDAVPALDCWAIHFPGFQGMGLDRVPSKGLTFTALGEVTPQEEFHFHFPDGNASIARMLVRSLVPGSASGNTAEDIVTAKMDYGHLDHGDSPVHIRLDSTAVLDAACGRFCFRQTSGGGVWPRAKSVQRTWQSCGTGVLEYGHSVSLSGLACGAERGSALWGEGAAGLLSCGSPQLDSISQARSSGVSPVRGCITPP